MPVSKKIHVTTTVNGESAEFLCEPRQSLLEILRDTLRLTGAKEGCNNGNCGACTVLMNGVPVNSCIVLAVEAEGATLETVEGIDRKSTRLNSSHLVISYAVFCLKKKITEAT